MEEFELVGAQEWLLDLDEPPPKPPKPVAQDDLETVTGRNQFEGQNVKLPKLTPAPVAQTPIPTLPAKGPLPVQASAQPLPLRRVIQIRDCQKRMDQLASRRLPDTMPASHVQPVWAKNQRPSSSRSGCQTNARVWNIDETPAKAAWRAGQTFTDQIRLPAQYGHLKQRIIEQSKAGTSSETERAFFGRVMADSGAFILLPQNNERSLKVWGTPAQVRQARALISRFLVPYVPAEVPAKKRSENFAKIQSYSERKEERIDQVEKHESILQILRKKPDPSCMFPEKLIFLWPTEELPVESLGPQLEILDPLRVEFGYPIYVDDEIPNYIRVDGYDHGTILEIVGRLRAEWAELLAITHSKTKLYLVQPPRNFSSYEIKVEALSLNNGARLYIPILHGVRLTTPLLLHDCAERSLFRTKNANRLRDAVKRSLKGLRFLRGHVRMRLNMGKFLLQEYRDLKGNSSYSYEEFEAMLLLPKTRGFLVPGLDFQYGGQDLLARIAAATDLLSPYDVTAASLEDTKPLYAVNFEFQGEDASLLRLEAEFAKSPGSSLFEVFQRRWIRPWEVNKSGNNRPPLQIGIIDFESCDWQLEICALDFQEPSSISQALRAFSHSIRFRPGAKLEIRANIPRKVIFSNSVPVKRLVEKTAMRYRIKGTTYILEVARYDEYFSVFAGTTELAETPVTSWGALIFDLQWDNMLGQHANFRLGHTAEWVPSLHTFFPNLDIGGTAGMGTGLEQFVELARRVSLVLSPGSLTSAVKFVSTKPRAAAVAGPARQPVAGSGNSMVVAQGKSWADIAKS